MPADSAELAAASLLDKRNLQAAGVLLPIRLQALSFFSGRHPLGCAGEGMRFLRTRDFDAGQDNPRDIDKFSPPGEFLVTDWEAEAQASILLYADASASMQFATKSAVLNQLLLQLTYSLWRATDRVRAVLYDGERHESVGERNLKRQLEELMRHLQDTKLAAGRDVIELLAAHRNKGGTRADLIFLISDFCPIATDTEVADPAKWREVLRSVGCDVIPVVISFELAEGQRGCVRLWDAERREHRLTLLTPARIARINAQEQERTAGLETLFRRLGLDYVVLRGANDVYAELARLARWRRRHRK